MTDYTDILNRYSQQRQDSQVRATTSLVADGNPDEEAGNRRLANYLGTPVEAVRALPEESKLAAKVKEVAGNAATSPVLQRKYSEEDFARLAHDDSGVLSSLAAAAKYLVSAPGKSSTLGGDIKAGYHAMSSGAAGVGGALSRAAGTPLGWMDAYPAIGGNPLFRLSEGFMKIADSEAKLQKEAEGKSDTWLGGAVSSGVQSLAQNAPLILAALVPGGQGAALGAMGASAGGQTYQKNMANNRGHWTSFLHGTSDAVIEIGTELLPLKGLVDNIKAGTPLLTTMLKNAWQENKGEQIATVLQDLNEWAVNGANKGQTLLDYAKARPEAAAQTAIATLVGSGGNVVLAKTAQNAADNIDGTVRQQLVAQAEQHAAVLEGLQKTAEASKLLERSPETLTAYMQELADEGAPNVYIDSAKLVESGVDLQALAQVVPSIATQLEQVESGGDLVIPTSELLVNTIGTEFAQSLIDHARTDVNGMSREEAKVYMQEKGNDIQAEVERVMTEKANDAEFKAGRDEVQQQILKQLNEVQRFTGKVNEQYATLAANFYSVMAARTGMTPQAFAQRYQLGFSGTAEAGGSVLDQEEINAAEAAGFDSTTTWLHGTTRNFKGFKVGKGGVDELGPGVYFTKEPRYADAWSGGGRVEGGQTIPAFIKKGDLFDKSQKMDYLALAKRLKERNPVTDAERQAKEIRDTKSVLDWTPEESRIVNDTGNDLWRTWLLESDEDLAAQIKRGEINIWLDRAGYVGATNKNSQVPDQVVVFRPENIRSPWAKFNPRKADSANILNQGGFDQTQTEAFKRWSNDAPLVDSASAETYDFKTGQKVVLEAFHGTARPDRVGTVFQKKRATSGPMAFFTSNPELASSYAKDKADTSLANEDQDYANWFKFKPQGQRSSVDVVRAWYSLTPEQKTKISELAPRVTYSENQNEDGSNTIILGDEGHTDGTGSYDYNLQQTQRGYDKRGNPLKALVEDWLNSGNLFNDEEQFLKVLQLAGFPVKDITYDSPHSAFPFVYKAYVEMQKPLVTDDVPQDVIDALKGAAKKDRSRSKSGGADMWDKNTRTLKEWVANYTDPSNASASFVWTSIPDKVTDVLKSMGYDGIVDWSGKGGGNIVSPVYIPFAENQVKSAIGNKGKFDSSKKDILHQSNNGPVARGAFSLERDNQSILAQTLIDRTGFSAQQLADVLKSVALLTESNSVGGDPSLVSVLSQVRAAVLDNPKVLDAVVGSVPVDVVNNLFGSQSAAKVALHDEAMLQDSPTFNADLSVPGGLGDTPSPVSLLVRQAALGAAEVAGVSLGAGVETGEGAAAVGASQRDAFNQGSSPRAQIAFGSDITLTRSIISLFANADLSSFIHESGHFFLEVQADLASRITARIAGGQEVTEGERGIVADFNTTLAWMGVNASPEMSAIDHWYSLTAEEKRPYHEQWARGFEAYAFEGKAPSLDLQHMFQTFRAWLVNVYRTIKDNLIGDTLNVQLNDEVRAVMDRMLATSDQIAEAEAARQMGPLFKTAEEAGMTLEEFKAYHDQGIQATMDAVDELQAKGLRDMQWLQNARSRKLKELQKQHDALRAEITRQVRTEVMAQPIYRAWAFLTSKSESRAIPGVTDLETADLETADLTMSSGKLRTQVLRDMYGIEDDAVWRKLSNLHMTSDEIGLHPDHVAELFEFSSGDELVQKLADAEDPKSVVEGMTDTRMLQEHGDLASPAGLERAADAAIHNDARARFVATELKALQKAMSVREKVPGQKNTVDVLARAAKDYASAIIAKLKVRDIRPAQYAAAEVRSAKAAQKAAGDLAKATMHKRNQLINMYAAKEAYAAQDEVKKAIEYFRKFDKPSKTIDPEYTAQIEALLERFDLRASTSLAAIDKRASLVEWVQSQVEQGLEPAIPPELLQEANRKSFKEMTLEEVRGLRDTIKQIEHIGRLKNRLLTSQANKEFQAVVEEMATSINLYAGDRQADTRTPNTVLGEKLVSLKNFWASHIKAATWARVMDGGKDGGPVWEYLIRTANHAGDTEVVMREKATKELHKLVEPIRKEGKLGGKGTYFKEIDRSLNKEARLAIALNVGNASNLQRLLGGEGWTLEQIQPVLNSLSAADWQFVQAVWDHFESYRPLIAAKETRVYGKEPEWVEPTPVNTQHGTLRGGYYPVKYDPRASERAESHADAEDAKRQLAGAYTSATTRRSFTKARVEEVKGRPLLYSLDGIYNGVQEVIHDLTWHEWLIDANKLVRNKRIAEAIRSKYGPDAHRQFKTWLEDNAAGDRGAQNAGEKALAWARQGVSISGLGWNLMSAAIQPLGLTQSIVRIGPKWVGKGISKALGSPLDTVDEINEKSEFMRTRALTRLREIAEVRSQVKGRTKAREMIDTSAYFFMMRAQQLVDVPTWWGAYEKAISEGNDESRAIALSDQAVIDAQGSGTVKDQSAIERGGPVLKLFTTFYSFFNVALNLGVQKTMTSESKAKLAADYMLLYSAPVILAAALKDALVPGDSGDWDDEKILKRLIGEHISFLMGLMFGVREASSAVQAATGTNQFPASYSGPAGLRLADSVTRLGKEMQQGEMDDGLRKAVINTAGMLLRLPSAQINRTVTGAQALRDGKTENLGALLTGYQEPH